MDGAMREGTFKRPNGEFVKIEISLYPRKRFVVRELEFIEGRAQYKNNKTPELKQQEWEALNTWL